MNRLINWGKPLERSKKQLEREYRRIFPTLQRLARKHGYNLILHGSLRRDMDLVAVPWVESASSPDELADALQQRCCGWKARQHEWGTKPHGRKAVIISIAMNAMIDLSVVPFLDPRP